MQGIKPVIEVTDAAVEQFKKLLSISGATKSTIRIFLSEGCCYYFYDLNTTKDGEDGDILIENANLKIYVDPAMFEGFLPMAIDYKDGLLAVVGDQGNSLATGPLINMKGEKP